MVNTKKLRAKLVEKGVTQEEMAYELGMSSCTLGKKIRNIADVTLSEAERIMNILDIPIQNVSEYFFYNIGNYSLRE